MTDLSGILQLAHGGTGVSNLNALKQLLGITSDGASIITGTYYNPSGTTVKIQSPKPIKLCIIPCTGGGSEYHYRYIFITDTMVLAESAAIGYWSMYSLSHGSDGIFRWAYGSWNADKTQISISGDDVGAPYKTHYVLFV